MLPDFRIRLPEHWSPERRRLYIQGTRATGVRFLPVPEGPQDGQPEVDLPARVLELQSSEASLQGALSARIIDILNLHAVLAYYERRFDQLKETIKGMEAYIVKQTLGNPARISAACPTCGDALVMFPKRGDLAFCSGPDCASFSFRIAPRHPANVSTWSN